MELSTAVHFSFHKAILYHPFRRGRLEQSLCEKGPALPNRRLSPVFFRVGEEIPNTGIYCVYRSDHRVTHELTLTEGHTFPPCAECKDQVQFELLVAAPLMSRDSNFKVRLYEIPHPRKSEGESA